eukprot:Nitzschia sp. Nitz4//scaffold49_size126201//23612//24619//NITZ4_003631-RA/size126201-augustus-gene-0.1-mRNA-1//1//CDS//3329553116//4194//frame0
MAEATTAAASDEIPSWGPNVSVSKHPVLFHKISILRSSATPSGQFRSVLRELTYHLGYEATKDLNTRPIPVSVDVGKEGAATGNNDNDHLMDCKGHKIADKIALIPILRSGLGMTTGMLELLPTAAVYHIGMYRIPGAKPVQYFNRLPRKCTSDVAFVVDPVIGSAETMLATLAILKKWGVAKIHVISVVASKQGLTKIQELFPDVQVTVGMVDEILTDNGMVLPGLGDCGQRLYATEPIVDDEDDESLLHPSKRKRSVDYTPAV